MLRIWIDYKNSHEPAFFRPFIRELAGHEMVYTARDYAEITALLALEGIEPMVVGRHYGGKKGGKMLGFIKRDLGLALKVPSFDVSMSHVSVNAIHVARLKRKKVVAFNDNDIKQAPFKITVPFIDYFVIPEAVPPEVYREQGGKKCDIRQYRGFKEDIYVADFTPDPDFGRKVPFSDFVAIRPEAVQAGYFPKDEKSLVPELIEALARENVPVLLLPRYPEEREMHAGHENVHVPERPLKGLDVCWHARALLTGSGTFAREAAALGTPAVEFIAHRPLAVDTALEEEGRLLITRDVQTIVDHILEGQKREPDLERSRRVQVEVMGIARGIMEEIESDKAGSRRRG